MKKSPYLEVEEVEFLLTHGETQSLVYLSKTIGRSWNFVKKCLDRLGIKNNYDNSRKWIPSESDIQALRSGMTVIELASILNHSIPSIRKQMRLLSIIEPMKKREFNPAPRMRLEPVKLPTVPRISGEDRIKEALRRIGV